MRWLGVAALIGCGSASPPPLAAPAAERETAIIGRVLLDGSPVTYFGVALAMPLAPDILPGILEPIWGPYPLSTKDGRFRLPVAAGTLNLVIAGPGFARAAVSNQNVEAGKTRDLGDIAVSRGHTIHGTVRDGAGAPIAGARVDLGTRDTPLGDDDLSQRTWGYLSDTTDHDGHYRIDGVTWAFGPPCVGVAARDGAALPVEAPDADATIDLTVVPTGRIEVTVHSVARVAVFAKRGGPCGMMVIGTKEQAVRTSDLPPGDYDVFMAGPEAGATMPQHVSIVAGTVTTVAVSL